MALHTNSHARVQNVYTFDMNRCTTVMYTTQYMCAAFCWKFYNKKKRCLFTLASQSKELIRGGI